MTLRWCQTGAMDLSPYVDGIRRELAVAAEAGGDDARALAERLTAPLESAVRLMLLEALSAAADEVTRELAPGSVELRLRSGAPEFAVTPPPGEPIDDPEPATEAAAPPRDADEGATARINLRLPEHLKAGIEQAAGRERLSVNAWMVRVAAAALARDDQGRRPRRGSGPGQRYTGWGRWAPSPFDTDLVHPHQQEGTPMPTFDTPRPISVSMELPAGAVRLSGGERATTVVDVQPSDPSNDADVRAAQATRVEYAEERLIVKSPKQGLRLGRRGGSVDVTIELPAGSNVDGTAASADFDCDGRLGDCRLRTALGRIRVDRAGVLNVKTHTGDVDVETATGHADIATGSGDV